MSTSWMCAYSWILCVWFSVYFSKGFAAETNPILSAIALPSFLLSFIYPHLSLFPTTLLQIPLALSLSLTLFLIFFFPFLTLLTVS